MLAQYQKMQQSVAAESEAAKREVEITPP